MANLKKQNTSSAVRTLSKTQAKQQFSQLVDSLAANGGIVEITDYDKVAAVMLGYRDYISLLARAGVPLLTHKEIVQSMRALSSKIKPDKMSMRQMIEDGRRF